ncbi:unnamed protein product [Trifolium pratense]|uniref:Uncharacterized protein n=1 Tax=Trifolium pratense TaxID=57577 RepID=A0ACB0LU99_TRIPR|nr:unnamed protein product [Trifolium pratense]
MSSLPEELWTKILELGIQNSGLTYEDLCWISISCRLLHRLSSEDSLWNHLLSTDFPLFPACSFPYWSSKSLYLLRIKERILIEAAYQQRLVEEQILHYQEQQEIELSKQHHPEDLIEKKRLSRMVENKEIYIEKVVNRRLVEFKRQVEEFNRLKRAREKMRKLKYYLQLQEANRKKQEETERLAKLAEIHYKQRKREIEIAGLYHKKW